MQRTSPPRGLPLRFELGDARLQRGELRLRALQEPSLHLEILAQDHVEAIEEGGEQGAQVFFEILGGRNVLEHGVQASYLEHWWRLEDAGGYFLGIKVMRNQGHGQQRVREILSVAGDHFIYARNRAFDLPMANSLADLIRKEKYTRKQILAVLDCEVSHGFVLGGRQPWEVQFSTLPFKENKPLEFAQRIQVDPRTGQLSERNLAPDLIWSMPINTLGIEDLLVLFPPT